MFGPCRGRPELPVERAVGMCGRIVMRAIGAGVARFLHTEEVTGSIPVSPTSQKLVWLHLFRSQGLF
jgi:hypothetical protein